MDTVRYALAILMLLTLPGAYVFWFIIHPFIGFWRKRGMLPAYVCAFGTMIVIAIVFVYFRDILMGQDLGTNWWLFALGLSLYLACWVMERLVRKHLKFKTLVGVPEIRNDDSQKLITEGMYQLVRHPRYLTIIVGIVGWSLIANYSGIYLLTAVSVPLLVMITVFEERELVERFGEEYQAYRRKVPRIIPSIKFLRKTFGN